MTLCRVPVPCATNSKPFQVRWTLNMTANYRRSLDARTRCCLACTPARHDHRARHILVDELGHQCPAIP